VQYGKVLVGAAVHAVTTGLYNTDMDVVFGFKIVNMKVTELMY
jgi:hypothetical protein